MSATRPIVRGTVGCVASSNYMATIAGLQVLLEGGNAFDVAAATGFALHVVEPHVNGLGGEAPAILYSAKKRKAFALSGQGYAPARATLEYFRANRIDIIPGDGFLPATVPASFDLWITLLSKFGTMTLSQVVRPALRLAEEGFPVYPTLAQNILAHSKRFSKEWPTTARIYLPNGKPPRIGQRLVQRDLASTLRTLIHTEARFKNRQKGLASAREYFYSGPIAKQIINFTARKTIRDATRKFHSGLLQVQDLSEFKTRVESPVSVDFRELRVYKCGPWSQGPVFLQQLRLLEEYNLQRLGHNSARYIHLLTELSKLAFEDRERYYGDPLFTPVPMKRLLSREYAAARRKLFDRRAASVDTPIAEITRTSRKPELGFDGDTTHLDVADHEGNMVSITPSGGWIWASPIIEGLGFALSTRGQMFWLDASHPNCLAPHKRPRTTLSPTLVTLKNRPYMAFGTPGGDQQDQWTLQFFLNHTEFGMDLQSAIDAATFHNSHFPSSFYPRAAEPGVLYVEGRIPSAVRTELRRMGHKLVTEGDWVNGRVTSVRVDRVNGMIEAAASSRYQTAYAAGV